MAAVYGDDSFTPSSRLSTRLASTCASHLLRHRQVMRQFGLEQMIPAATDTSEKLHLVDQRESYMDYESFHGH